MIPVTKPFLPPVEQYERYIKEIWQNNWVTNNGPLLKSLENQLQQYLNCEPVVMLSNGTIGLQLAIKAMGLSGEVITTPFSYIATANSIIWERCTPVFVDIDSHTYNIDPKAIENAISECTTGIIATHVFGNACDIDHISAIASRHHLKVIYDAAHSFGVTYQGSSILNYGDISVISFHATKIFHSIEGGAIVAKYPDIQHRCKQLRNFGHAGTYEYDGIGINAKNSELHTAMGLCMLDYVDEVVIRRKQQYLQYQQRLGGRLQFQQLEPNMDTYNYAYCPVVFPDENSLDRAIEFSHQQEVYPRRYFYPSLDHIVSHQRSGGPLPNTHSVADRILCLPLYHDLREDQIDMIADLILKVV